MVVRWVAAVVVIVILCAGFPERVRGADEPVQLRGDRWTITIHPETLGVEAKLIDGGTVLVISSPNEKPAQVGELQSDNSKASWAVVHERAGVGVSMRLESDVL